MAGAPSLHLVLLGTSFKTSPLSVRERMAIPSSDLPQVLHALKGYIGQAVLLSTCNRTELYFIPKPGQGLPAAYRFLRNTLGFTRLETSRFFYRAWDIEAARHLFRVVCGLDSQAVGEAEVLGQVRHAFHLATRLGMTAPPLDRVFQFAFWVARQARKVLAAPAPSLAYIAVNKAIRAVPQGVSISALVVGAGEAGSLAAHALREQGAAQVWVANRTYARALAIAQAVGGQAVLMDEIGPILTQVDIVVAAVSAPHPVLPASLVAQALTQRLPGHPLCIVDIAVPRAVAPEVAGLPGVSLYTLDDLMPIQWDNSHPGRDALQQMEEVVEGGVARFAKLWRSLPALSAIAVLHQQGEAIRRQETERVLRYLRGLDSQERAHIEAFGKALVRRLFHPVVEHLKTHPNPTTLRNVRALFGLDGTMPATNAFFPNGTGDEEATGPLKGTALQPDATLR